MTGPAQIRDPLSDAPWADDDESTSQRTTGASPVSRGMLRGSLILLIASTLVMFLAAVASNNAIPSSSAERIALGVHRMSMVGMLLAFSGILIAYRLPALSEYVNARREPKPTGKVKQLVWVAELRLLLVASAMLTAWIWLSIMIGHALLQQINYWLLMVIAAVLANMVLLHKGVLRSFAVGMLISLSMVLLSWRSLGTLVMLGGGGYGFGFGGLETYRMFVVFGIEVTLSVAAGLVCALYYQFVASIRSRAAESDPLGPTA